MKLSLIPAAIIALAVAPLHGQLLFDQDITPDVIFGSGNANGAWTVNQNSGIELGLRAKVRFDETGYPANVFNSNGDGTYTFAPGSYTNSARPDWNFEWSVNSNFDGSGDNLTAFTYILSLDLDPTAGTFFVAFDPVNVPVADNAIGDNTTPNGGGTVDETPNYLNLISANNVAQNSWAYNWFDPVFDPNATGLYTIKLDAFSLEDQGWLGGTEITVNVSPVPEPATIGLFSIAGMGALLFVRRRIKARA